MNKITIVQAATLIALIATGFIGTVQVRSAGNEDVQWSQTEGPWNTEELYIPGLDPDRSAGNALVLGDIDQAMDQARRLAQVMQTKSFDEVRASSPELLFIEDQKYAESASSRETNSFMPMDCYSAYEGEVLFVCDTYVRRNLHITKRGAESEGYTKPEGFYIVGWVDGTVTQVPVHQVRLVPAQPSEGGGWVYVFPGMSAYEDLRARPFPGVTTETDPPPSPKE